MNHDHEADRERERGIFDVVDSDSCLCFIEGALFLSDAQFTKFSSRGYKVPRASARHVGNLISNHRPVFQIECECVAD